MNLIQTIIYACSFLGLLSATVDTVENTDYLIDLEKGELYPKGCGCGIRPQPARHQQLRHRSHRRASSSSSSSTTCPCVPKPPYPMPPSNPCCDLCPSSSSSSSESCQNHFPTVCPKQQALQTAVAFDKQFVAYINQQNFVSATAMLQPNAGYINLDEVAPGPVCAVSTGLIVDLFATQPQCAQIPLVPGSLTLADSWLYSYIRFAKHHDDGSVSVHSIEVVYYNRDILTVAREVIRRWVPTYGCNFKLSSYEMTNLVCLPQIKQDVLAG